MIRHIVLIRFRPDLGEDDIAALFEELHRMEGKLPGLLSVVSGRSESPEHIERGYMHGFVADFADRYPDAAILLTGAGDPTSSIHAPDESQHVGDLERCVLAEALALQALADR